MRATNWEFTYRGMIFGMIFGVAFPLYALDSVNSTQALADWLAPRLGMNADGLARALFALAALLLSIAALLRTWASAYLKADVVYGSDVRSDALVADGPYRRVRNPLYFANVLMIISLGAMMSRLGFAVAFAAMLIFCYRLIFREEADFQAKESLAYRAYVAAVPRLWPALTPRVPSAGRRPDWRDGFKAESWYWGFAAAMIAFAATLSLPLFFAILTASVALFWLVSYILQKNARANGSQVGS